jgi:WD40 repeat protein
MIPLGAAVPGHEASIYGLAFSPDGRWLASTSVDTKVGIWNVADRTLHKFLHGHSGALYSSAFSADGRRLAAAGEDGVVRLWDTATWQEVAAFHAHASLNKADAEPLAQRRFQIRFPKLKNFTHPLCPGPTVKWAGRIRHEQDRE